MSRRRRVTVRRLYEAECSECGVLGSCRSRVDAALAVKEHRERHRQIPHGTASRYNNRGCRCQLCTSAMTDDRRERRAMLAADAAAGKMPTIPHGTASTYRNYGCRCEDCREAAVRSSREYRARKARSDAQA